MATLYSKEKLNIIEKIRQKWESETVIWGSGLFGPPIAADRGPLPKLVLEENSFIYQVTKNKVSIENIIPLSVDFVGSNPASVINFVELKDWNYYVFDWHNYQNIIGNAVEYNSDGDISDSFEKLVMASLPYAVRMWGKQLKKSGAPVEQKAWFKRNVQFGGYSVETRAAFDTLLSNVNPGLMFLIGINKCALRELDADKKVKLLAKNLEPEKSIIVRIDSIDKEFNKIADTLKTYDKIREELDVPFKTTPQPFNFKEKASSVKEFKNALKALLANTANKAAEMSDNYDNSDNCTNVEGWARDLESWNKPGNIIEIAVTTKWEVAFIREYAPETTFKKRTSTKAGIIVLCQLSQL